MNHILKLIALTLSLLTLTTASRAATVCWDGGGDGVNWNDPANWCGDLVPGPNDDVELNNGTTATVSLSSGTVTIRSLQTTQPLVISMSASLTVTTNASVLQGRLTFSTGATLQSRGLGTSLLAANAMNINDAN